MGGCDIQLGAPGAEFPATITGNNWQALENSATPTYAIRSYYDLSGFNLKDLTVFIQGVNVQEAHPAFGNASCTIVDMVTTEYVDDETLVASYKYTSASTTGHLPGFPESTFDMNQVVHGQTRTFTLNQSWADISIQGVTTFGTGSATSAQKLYITRVVFVSTDPAAAPPASVARIPASNFVAIVTVAKEEDLSYVMRQKRSYEHAKRI